MRAAILDAVARATPLSGRERLLHAPGSIVEALLAEGVEPYLVLSAACAASGLPAARRAWLEGPVPTWPADFDPGMCRQLGACPVALRKGQWVVAYADPEIAVAADSLGLPEHVRALALPRDLERFFAAAPRDENPFDRMATTDAGDLFAPMSQLEPALATDKIAAPASATADDDAADDDDADDDDLDLYVDRLADQLTQQQVRPTPGPPPPARRPPASLDPPVRPAAPPRPVRPAPSLTSGNTRAVEPRAGSRRMGATGEAAGAPASTWKPAEPPQVPTGPSRAGLLVAGAVACGVVAALVWPRLKPPPPPPPDPASAIVVKDGSLEFTAAQEALLQKARAERDHAVAVRLLSEAIRLDPQSTVARTALLERVRRALSQGQLTQADNDLERLRRRRDAAAVQAEIDALAAQRQATRPMPPTTTTPPTTTPPAPTPTPAR